MRALRSRTGFLLALGVLAAALPVSLAVAASFGTNALPVDQVYTIIRWELGHLLLGQTIPAQWAPGTAVHDVVWLIRLPRLVLAAAVGGLPVSVRRGDAGGGPEPPGRPLYTGHFLGGVPGGYAGGAAGGWGAALGQNAVGVMAFLGALAVSCAVVFLANLGGRASPVKLLLAGSALSAVCGAFSNFVVYQTGPDQAASQVMRWTMGSLAAASWPFNGVMLGIALLGTVFFLSQSRGLNLMLLGDETARTLGVDLHRRRLACLAAAALMTGFAVWAAGIIGFVGLVVPHVVRMLFGTDHRRLVPLSALTGGLFLLWDAALDCFCPAASCPWAS